MDDKSNHSSYQVESNYSREKRFNYIILDDFICSGGTVYYIASSMKKYFYKNIQNPSLIKPL